MARRVNTKFLTVLTVVVVVLGVAALAANKFLVRESPEKYVAAGTTAMADKRYEDAAKAYARAVNLDQRNPSLWVAYGDALNQLSPNDVEFMRRARAAWDQALAVDPNNKPALDRMMQFWSDIANLSSSSPDVFTQLESTAKKLYAADDKNAAAEIAIQTAIIRPWLAGVEKDEQMIKNTIGKLQGLMVRYPQNPDLAMFAAQGKLRLSERERQRSRTEEAKKLAQEADTIMEEAVKRSPTSAAMYFSAAQVAQAQEQLSIADAKVSADWRQKKQGLYNKACELAKPEDPLFVFIHIAAARASADNPTSEKILRELMIKQPDDQQVRLALAEQLAAVEKTRKEALEILEKPFASSNLKGPRAFMIRELQIRTLIMATNLRLDQFSNNPPKEERDKLLRKIQETLAMIEMKDGVDSARPLRLRGKLLRLQGENIKAIQTLEKARTLAEKNANAADAQGDRLDRWEVIDLLARCYIETQQTGRAKQLLLELVNRFPGYEPGRMLLAQLMVKEGNLDDAKPHVAYLLERRPSDPDVIKLRLQVLNERGVALTPQTDVASVDSQKRELRATYDTLPETNQAEMLDKVTAAMVVDHQEDAIRLLNKAQAANPGDYDVARMGVRVYRFLGELDKVKSFVDVAVKANPKDDKLLVLQRQVQDLSPEAILNIALKEIEKEPDPVKRSMGLANIYRRQGKLEEALKELQSVQRARPNDTAVTAQIFKNYLLRQQWDKAESLLDTLSAANQDQAGGLLFRYQLAMSKNDHVNALKYARDLVQRMGEFGQSWLALAQVLQITGQTEEALSKYLVAVEKQSDSYEALRGIVDCYYALSRPGDAKRTIDKARKALPSNPEFKELEIRHQLSYGDPEKAIAPREETAKKSPDEPNTLLALGQAYLSVARNRASKPKGEVPAAEMFSKAKVTFKQGVAKWPDEIAFYAYYAETCARSGELADSEKVLKALAARPAWKDKSEPRALLAEFYAVAKRPADAEAIFRDIIAKEPANTDVQVRLANLLTSQNKTDEALKLLQANIQDPRVSRRRVEILMALQRNDEADQVIAEALEKSPSNLDLLHLGAMVDMTQGKFDRAEKRLNRALEIDTSNPTTHYYVGTMRMKQPKADYKAAIDELTKGRDSPTMGTEARFALADCLRRMGNADGSLRELEAALSSQPGNWRVRLGLIDAYLGSVPPRWNDADRVIKDAKALPGYVANSELLERESNMWAARNDPAQALKAIQEARATAPADMVIARKYVNTLLKLKKYPEINQEVDQLLAKDKNLWWAYSARGVARRFQGKKEESIKDFDAALAVANDLKDDNAADEIVRTMGDVIGPDEVIDRIRQRAETDNRWKLMIARLQSTKGDNDAALKTMEQILAYEDTLLPQVRESSLRFAAMLYLVVNQPEKSAKQYEKLLAISPNDTISLNNMACLLAETVQPPRPQDGLKYSQQAYNLMQAAGRRDAILLDTHGWLLTLCGRVDEGTELLRAANDVAQLPDIHYHLAEAYLRKGFGEEAQKELEIATNLIKKQQSYKAIPDVALQQLLSKVENAQARAAVVRPNGKKPTANVPTGTNVP